MLRRLIKFQSSRVFAVDGEVGKVRDVYFDDVTWVVRYLVVDTGGWLPGRKVLISPQSVELTDAALRTVSLSLTHARIEASPSMDSDKPVSRQYESEFNRYYSIPPYWTQARQWSTGALPLVSFPSVSDAFEMAEEHLEREPHSDTHLMSAREVSGYTLKAIGGSVGHLGDFLFDEGTWAIRYLMVETGVWLFGHQLLIDKEHVREVDQGNQCVAVDLTRHQIELAPHLDPAHLDDTRMDE